MVGRKITKVRSDDQDLVRQTDNISVVTDWIQQSVLTGPNSIVEVDLTTSASNVSHKLGRRPIGYLVINIDTNAVVYNPSASDNPALTIVLQASAATTAKVLFF